MFFFLPKINKRALGEGFTEQNKVCVITVLLPGSRGRAGSQRAPGQPRGRSARPPDPPGAFCLGGLPFVSVTLSKAFSPGRTRPWLPPASPRLPLPSPTTGCRHCTEPAECAFPRGRSPAAVSGHPWGLLRRCLSVTAAAPRPRPVPRQPGGPGPRPRPPTTSQQGLLVRFGAPWLALLCAPGPPQAPRDN